MSGRGTAALVLALVAGGFGLEGCGRSNDAGPPVPVDVASLYAQMCARCHGPDGRGDAEMKKSIPGIRDFSEAAFRVKSPDEVEGVIMAGRNQMPAFGAALTRPKIQHLGGYVRQLGELAAMGLPAGAAAPGAGAPPAPAGAGK